METFWESFRLDPRQPQNATMRASDTDREIVRGALADAYGDGRLTREEYDDRLNALYGSRALGELIPLVSDLVRADSPPVAPVLLPHGELRVRGARKWRKNVEESLAAFLVPSIICTVIWIASGGRGFFWPLFPMMFLGVNLVRTVVGRESVIEGEVRRLEEQAAKDAARIAPQDTDDPGGRKNAGHDVRPGSRGHQTGVIREGSDEGEGRAGSARESDSRTTRIPGPSC